MAVANLDEYLRLLPATLHAPHRFVWSSYDAEADVLYINFTKPSQAADSELTDDDVIVRYDQNNQIVGFTILHASKRSAASAA